MLFITVAPRGVKCHNYEVDRFMHYYNIWSPSNNQTQIMEENGGKAREIFYMLKSLKCTTFLTISSCFIA
jgi:coenzyme F420-reducing hydrogenase alpha subunit